MSNLGFFNSIRHIARFNVKLLVGVWLLACLPVMAQTPSRFQESVLLAQSEANLNLQYGSSGPQVEQLQRALGRNGLFPYEIDGVYGDDTRQAVRQFQRIRRLEVTGLADYETLLALDIDPNSLLPSMVHPAHGAISTDLLRFGDRSSDVQTLQQVLVGFGFGLPTTGYYGDETRQAVRTYQRTAGLVPVNGIADRGTLLHMGFEPGGGATAGTAFTTPGGSRNNSRPLGNSATQGSYVAAVIAGRSELAKVRSNFPYARIENNRIGDYISLGRFTERSEASDLVDAARDLGYESRILRD
ncbi:MAG: peptidoglycan-binding protein [Cyanobacteria bacterium P01_F01_bin.13]